MKTREEFVLLADAYRKEKFWREWLIAGMLTPWFAALLITSRTSQVVGNQLAWHWIKIALIVLPPLILLFYKAKSLENLARKYDLICPSCSRSLGDDLKTAIATHDCPHCGKPQFKT